MTRFHSRRITDLKQSDIRNMMREHRLRYAEEAAVLHEAAERARFHSRG
ncbi:MAG: hypothetical protein ACREVH_06500 [Gammaproteobacteria bacterium]